MKAILKGIVNEKTEYSQELLKKIEEFGKLSDEVDQSKNEYERLREKYKALESELQPIIKTLEQLDSRTIQANNYLISIKKMGYDKISYKYSQVLEKVMEMVNADLKKAINEMLQNSAVITRVATSIGVQNVKKVREGIIDTFLYAPPKLVPVIIRDYSLTFGKKQYEKDTIFGDANSHHSTVA